MESKGRGFRAGVRCHTTNGHEACHASCCDDVTVVLRNHCRDELLYHQEVRESIDLEDFADDGFRLIDNRSGTANASIVEKDSWISVGFPDRFSKFFDAACGGYIALVEMDVRCSRLVSFRILKCLQDGQTYEVQPSAPEHLRQRQ